MLGGLLFLMAIATFGLIVLWAITTDAPGIEGGVTGLFAVKTSDAFGKDPQSKRKTGRREWWQSLPSKGSEDDEA